MSLDIESPDNGFYFPWRVREQMKGMGEVAGADTESGEYLK